MSGARRESPARAFPLAPSQADGRERIFVYRHRLAPLSEVGFLRRFYIGFERLAPIWLGCHRDEGARELAAKPLFLGRGGALGALDRTLFRQLGVLPPFPDLGAQGARLIHAHFGRGGAFALPIAKALGIPLVVTFHGGDATKERHYRRHLLPHVFERRLEALKERTALFVCVSGFVRDCLLARGFPPEKLVVIHQGIEIDPAPLEPPAAGAPYVLFVGRFVEKKGAAHLIAAARLLEKRAPQLAFVLVGDGALAASLKEEARSLSRVSFPGWLPQGEVRRLMRGALALAVPSVTARSGDAEGLPTVVLEAMSEGVPVIGSDHPGIAEAVEDGRTGLIVPAADPEALAGAIAALLARPQWRERMGEAARAAAALRFSALTQSRRLEEALLKVIEAGSR